MKNKRFLSRILNKIKHKNLPEYLLDEQQSHNRWREKKMNNQLVFFL